MEDDLTLNEPSNHFVVATDHLNGFSNSNFEYF